MVACFFFFGDDDTFSSSWIDLAYYLALVWVKPLGCSMIVSASLSLLGVMLKVHLL